VDGTQAADGSVKRFIGVFEGNTVLIELTSARARQLARALLAASSEIEDLSEYDRIEVSR
jgi:hypothetical protein